MAHNFSICWPHQSTFGEPHGIAFVRTYIGSIHNPNVKSSRGHAGAVVDAHADSVASPCCSAFCSAHDSAIGGTYARTIDRTDSSAQLDPDADSASAHTHAIDAADS
jgi:hypothetical protein